VTTTRRVHIVRRNETLSRIARHYGITVRALAQHNGIRDINLIRVGQRLAIASTTSGQRAASVGHAATASLAAGGTTRLAAGRLSLTATDVLNVKKTLQTEWVQSAGTDQAHGIVDTILNRTASQHWGRTVADVVNATNQFSDINGPISRRHGRRSVAQLPASVVSRRVDQLVDAYLAERAAGRSSSIGSHLNYANPHYSDAKNLAWINALDGPRLGRGKAIHHHGTVPELQRYRPGSFAVELPHIVAESTPPITSGRRLDGNAVAAANGVAVKSGSVKLGQLDPQMEPVIRAVAAIARQQQLPSPVITSGNDSRHKRGSLHYADRALDFRGNNITVAQGRALRDAVRTSLGGRYDVEFEVFVNATNNHLHVEYDPD
jgi:LysM repeat protein